MAKYLVTVPYRGVQSYLVEAKSASEAKRKVDEFGEDEDQGIEPVDYYVVRTYSACSAVLDGNAP